MDGKTCADINECKQNPRICNGGKCENTEGKYRCHCTNGLIPGPGDLSCLGKFLSLKQDSSEMKQKKNVY